MLRIIILLGLSLIAPLSLAQPESELYEQAITASSSGDDAGASIFLKNALQRNPMHLPSRILLGQLYLKNGEPAAAEKELRRALDLEADPNLVLLPLGYSMLLLENFDGIINYPLPLTISANVSAEWSMILGRAFLGNNQPAQAYAVFERLVERDPSNVGALLGQANARFAERDYANAEQIADKILSIDPGTSSAWKIKGDIARLSDQSERAIELYTRTLEEEPASYAAQKDRALLLLERGEQERALSEIEALAQEIPEDPVTVLINTWLLARSKQDDRAQELLDGLAQRLERVDDSFLAANAELQMAKGVAFYLQDRIDEALPLLNAYLSKQPSHTGIRMLLAGIAQDRGQTARVVSLLAPIAEDLDDSPELLAAYMRGLIDQEKLDEAVALGEKLHDLNPDDLALTQLLAGTLAYGGQTDRAIAVLTRGDDSTMTQRSGLVLGYLLLTQNQLPAALKTAEQLQTTYAEDATVANFAGAVFLRVGDLERAQAALDEAYALDDQSLPISLNRAYLTLKRGDTAAAREAFARLSERFPGSAEVVKALSDIDSATGDFNNAVQWTEKLVELEPDSYAHQYRLAALYLQVGRTAQTLGYVEQLERDFALDEQLLELKARALLAEGRFTEAKRWLGFLYGSNSGNADKIAGIAMLQMEAKDAEGAKRSVERLRKLEPDALSTQLLSARFELGTQDIDSATARLERAQRAHPRSSEVQELLADAYWRSGDQTGFRRHYERAQEIAPSAQRVRLASARFWQSGERSLAEQVLRSWVEQHSDDVTTRELHAQALLGLERRDDAYRAYKTLLSKDPSLSFSAYNNLANLAIELEPEVAKEYASKALELAPENAAVIDTLAWILVQEGNAEQALPLLRDAYSRASQNPSVQYHLASALAELERTGEAKRLLTTLLAAHPQFHERDAAAALLSKVSKALNSP